MFNCFLRQGLTARSLQRCLQSATETTWVTHMARSRVQRKAGRQLEPRSLYGYGYRTVPVLSAGFNGTLFKDNVSFNFLVCLRWGLR